MPHIRFHALDLYNFKSYRGKHRFEFPVSPGLYYLTGRNTTNLRLGANGVGKSTLLDALYWCLYGRTLRGLRGPEVISRGLTTASVRLTLSIGEKDYVIYRCQSPNLLTVNKLTVDQLYVNKLLRLTPDQFTYSIIFPQFGSPFLDRSPTEKLDLFSHIMDLDFWLERSKLAAVEVGLLGEQINKLEQQAAKQEGQYEALEAELPRLRTARDDFTQERNRTIRTLADRRRGLGDPGPVVAGLRAKAAAITKKQEVALQAYQKASETKGLAQAEVRLIEQTIEKLSKIGAVCPICNQTVSAGHRQAEKSRLLGTLKRAKANAEAALARLEGVIQRVDQLTADLTGVTKNLADWERQWAEAERLIDAIEAENARSNPYEGMIKTKSAEMAAIELSLTKLDDNIANLTTKQSAAEFWVAGFKRLRLFIVEETLRQLELEVNSSLASLGLPDWQITFDVERENKSGGITKGFTVCVQPPGPGGEPVRLEAWSGGEYQRLRLAGDLGIANLIMERAGLTNTIEFFDEPSRHLSAEGVADLAETLAQRADDTGRVIFLVDHTAIESSNFAGVITVTKDGDGSHVAI